MDNVVNILKVYQHWLSIHTVYIKVEFNNFLVLFKSREKKWFYWQNLFAIIGEISATPAHSVKLFRILFRIVGLVKVLIENKQSLAESQINMQMETHHPPKIRHSPAGKSLQRINPNRKHASWPSRYYY